MTPKTPAIKGKKNNRDYVKLKIFLTENKVINKMKKETYRMEKICAHHVSDKGLISRYIRNPCNSIAEKSFI